jgi:rubrerythrin
MRTETDEPDFDDEEIEDDEPDYYLCNCCGYTCVQDPNGWGCPKCTAHMEPQYY